MKYLPHSEQEIREMLEVLHLSSIEPLFDTVPERFRLKAFLDIPSGLSERDLERLIQDIAEKNAVYSYSCFAGGGVYNHYIPKVIDSLIMRQEFYTAYTPYQPEVSQGTLQAIFEFQTMVASIMGLDVANASMYDGSTASAEAVLMARRLSKRAAKIVLSSAIHPEYRAVIRSYLQHLNDEIIELPYDRVSGRTVFDEKAIDGAYAVVLQYPNFFGLIEDLSEFSIKLRERKIPLISITAEPLSLMLLKSPGSLGVDIAVAEGQSFGIPMSAGGPTVGWFATRKEYVRSMPGRLVGETVDKNGERVFVLTLSTREQHIRREKATSNICTNSGLNALANAIYMSYMGASGLKILAIENHKKAESLKDILRKKGVKVLFEGSTFNEFVVSTDNLREIYDRGIKRKILPGILIDRFYPELKNAMLIAVTEQNSDEDIYRLAEIF